MLLFAFSFQLIKSDGSIYYRWRNFAGWSYYEILVWKMVMDDFKDLPPIVSNEF